MSRADFIRQQLSLVLAQYRRHPKPRSAGVLGRLTQRGNDPWLSLDQRTLVFASNRGGTLNLCVTKR